MLSPITPAPMTTVFGRDDEAITEGVITDSLRRARPARFSGFDLSRSCRAASAAGLGGTPAFAQFRTEALPIARTFFASQTRPAPYLPVHQGRFCTTRSNLIRLSD